MPVGAGVADAADGALAYLRELTPDLRGAAILGGDGRALAATGSVERWSEAASALLQAADDAGERRADHVHVATGEGEVFAVRDDELAVVAVTERFVLASLTIFDMRAVLRDLKAGNGAKPAQ
jgi:predicted regulator of Ras-like GTPase activity (Roadblock/LC7/MglB family)